MGHHTIERTSFRVGGSSWLWEANHVPVRRHVLPPSVEMMRYDVDEVTWTMAAPSLGDANDTS